MNPFVLPYYASMMQLVALQTCWGLAVHAWTPTTSAQTKSTPELAVIEKYEGGESKREER